MERHEACNSVPYKLSPNISQSHKPDEQFVCGDEIRVQGRLDHHVGQILTSICNAMGVVVRMRCWLRTAT